LLAELERDADPAARRRGDSGAAWVAAALREAVASGSRFVAPKRIREIITRWATEPDRVDPTRRSATERSDNSAARSPRAARSGALSDTGDYMESDEAMRAASDNGSSGATTADVRLPGGVSGVFIWTAVLGELERVLEPDTFERLLAGSAIVRYRRGTVEVRVPSAAAAAKLSVEYRALVERHLNGRLRRPVALQFTSVSDVPQQATSEPAAEEPWDGAIIRVSPADAELGRQLWRALLDGIADRVTPEDQARLAGVALLGQDAHGALLLGAPTSHVRRLLDATISGG
jgi:hypothetical protein